MNLCFCYFHAGERPLKGVLALQLARDAMENTEIGASELGFAR